MKKLRRFRSYSIRSCFYSQGSPAPTLIHTPSPRTLLASSLACSLVLVNHMLYNGQNCGYSGTPALSPTSGPKLSRHSARNCGWICLPCGKIRPSPAAFGDEKCPKGRGWHQPSFYKHRCDKCPCLSSDTVSFLKEPCTEEYLVEKNAQRQKILDMIREESKKQEKLRLLKALDAERKKLESLLATKPSTSILASTCCFCSCPHVCPVSKTYI